MVEYQQGEGKGMNSFDDVRIDPPRGVVEATLYAAIDAVHRDLQGVHGWEEARLDVAGRDELAVLWNKMEYAAEGHRVWQNHTRAWSHGVRAQLLVLWWRDYLSRRHVRVVAGCGHMGARLPAPGPTRPPLACIYPANSVIVSQYRRFRLIVICACGAWGAPAEVGWMGLCCGPCYDRGDDEALVPLGWQAGPEAIERLAVSPDGSLVAMRSEKGEVEVRELATGRRLAGCRVTGAPGKVEWESAGVLAVGNFTSRDGADCAEGVAIHGLPHPFAFLKEGVVVQDLHNQAVLADRTTWEPIRHFQFNRPVRLDDMAVSPDERVLAAVAYDGVLLWAAESGWPWSPVVSLGACQGPVVFSPDGSLVAVQARAASAIPHVVLVDVARARHYATLGASTGALDFAFTTDGSRIATVGEDTLRVWDVRSRAERYSLSPGGGEGLRSLSFTPDGRLLLLGTSQGAVRVWPTEVVRAE